MHRFLAWLLVPLLLVSCAVSAPKQTIRQPLIIPITVEHSERYQNAKAWKFWAVDHEETVPKGLIIDGASVPRFAWSFMPPDGLHRAGALAHDWIYLNKGIMPSGYMITKRQADDIFYNFMVEAGVGRTRAGLAAMSVRWFGQGAWDSTDHILILPVDADAMKPARRGLYGVSAAILSP